MRRSRADKQQLGERTKTPTTTPPERPPKQGATKATDPPPPPQKQNLLACVLVSYCKQKNGPRESAPHVSRPFFCAASVMLDFAYKRHMPATCAKKRPEGLALTRVVSFLSGHFFATYGLHPPYLTLTHVPPMRPTHANVNPLLRQFTDPFSRRGNQNVFIHVCVRHCTLRASGAQARHGSF